MWRFSSRAAVVGAALLCMVPTTACVGGKQTISAEDKERLKAYVLDAVPPGAKKTDINFENKIHLVGYKLEPETAGAGATVKATYYWRCDDPIEEGWQLFTHVQHEGYDKPDLLDGVGPLREVKNRVQVLGPDRWERGKIYADEQSFTMPADLRGPDTLVYVGIWKGDARLRIISGPNDGDNRAIVGKIKTGAAVKAATPTKPAGSDVPMLEVGKLAKGEKIVVDGKGDDKAWAAAGATGPFVDVSTGRPNTSFPVKGAAKMTWDDDNLYVLIEVTDPELVGFFKDKETQPTAFTAAGQPKTWEHACAEIMIDPEGDGDMKDYYEIQVNPQNRVFKSQFDTLQKPSGGPNGPFGHEDWDPKMKTAVVAKGTIDENSDKDEGYTVEASIPWAAFEKGAKNRPPKPGDAWRMNFYAMKNNGGPSWSPILGQGNFHFGPRFGRVVWVTKEWLADRADGGAADAGAALLDAGKPVGDAGVGDAGAVTRNLGPGPGDAGPILRRLLK